MNITRLITYAKPSQVLFNRLRDGTHINIYNLLTLKRRHFISLRFFHIYLKFKEWFMNTLNNLIHLILLLFLNIFKCFYCLFFYYFYIIYT